MVPVSFFFSLYFSLEKKCIFCNLKTRTNLFIHCLRDPFFSRGSFSIQSNLLRLVNYAHVQPCKELHTTINCVFPSKIGTNLIKEKKTTYSNCAVSLYLFPIFIVLSYIHFPLQNGDWFLSIFPWKKLSEVQGFLEEDFSFVLS